jgi:hypothetical protein
MKMKYVGSVINLANGFSRACRKDLVGQMSDLIQDYRRTTDKPTVEGWEKFYDETKGLERIDDATEICWDMYQKIRENMDALTKEDVHEWLRDLIINKTFSGLQIQNDILQMVCEEDYRLATPEEESKGIDGFVDGKPVSIKPNTYKATLASTKEKIDYPIIYYKQTKNGLVVDTEGKL